MASTCIFCSCFLQKTSKQEQYTLQNPENVFTPSQLKFKNPPSKTSSRIDSASSIDFSRDHGSHPNTLTEWWYFNGHLNGPSGENYSYAFCLFRRSPLLYFAHISFTDENNNVFNYARKFYTFPEVKLSKQSADISYGKEQIIEQLSQFEFRIKARLKNTSLNLLLKLEKPPLLINGNGQIKMEGGKSFYYSLTRLKTSGTVIMEDQSFAVSGISWMDHQWGNFHVISKKWDWFSFQMEDGTDYNLFSFRDKKNRMLRQYSNIHDDQNTFFSRKPINISRKNWWHNQQTSHLYTTEWEIILPDQRDTFIVKARTNNQELAISKKLDFLPSYWEGACTVIKKTANGKIVKGLGFAEHFPYRGKKDNP
ncbi:MAG: lipocalin-like domain-containing protein [Chitinophagaceae bacterium]